MALQLWASKNGVPVDGPITALTGQIVLEELNQFSKSSVTVAAADRRAILAMQPYTLIELVQDGVGTIGFGYILNPRQSITENDDHTITLELAPLTTECTWRVTRRGWTAANALSIVLERLAALVPGWSGIFTDAGRLDERGQPRNIVVSVNLNSPTVLAGVLQVAQQFNQFVRLGRDPSTGAPTRVLEMGQFGAAPTVWLVSADGGDPDAMATNDLTRLVATVDREPNTVQDLVNVCVPFGGGQDDTLVTLERLWRILNDPFYPNYGRYGTAAGSVFPEYDGNYPISDPLIPPTGLNTYTATGILQGGIGTRSPTLDGHYDYVVYDATSYATYGHKEGQFIDSSLTYADSSVANQELTARALYIEAVTNFKRKAHPHHTLACTAEGKGRPTRAGDLVAVDYQRVSVDERGAVVEMNVTDSLRVMSVTRTFQGDNPPLDTYVVSNLGRFEDDDTTVAAQQAQQLVALQLNQGTSLAPMTVNDRGNVDALHPLVTHVSVPPQRFRWLKCTLRVDFLPYTGTATTAVNQTQDFTISIGAQNIYLPATSDVGINDTFGAGAQQIGGMPTHSHKINIFSGPGAAPDASTNYLSFIGQDLFANKGIGGNAYSTTTQILSIDLTPTSHGHQVPINHTLRPAGQTIAHIPASTAIATLPRHTHPLDQRIPDGPLPASCLVDINGQYLSSGLTLLSGTRNADGSFATSFEIDDLSVMLNAIAGNLTITLHPGTSAGNPYGVGMYALSMTLYGEFGGLTSTVRAQ